MSQATLRAPNDGTRWQCLEKASGVDIDIFWNRGHGARVRHSVNQSIPNNTVTTLTFDTEDFDTDGFHSPALPTRLTVPVVGIYHITASVSWPSNAAGLRAMVILLNGATTLMRDQRAPFAAENFNMGETTVELAAGDFVEVTVIQTSGGALNTSAQANYAPRLEMTLVR